MSDTTAVDPSVAEATALIATEATAGVLAARADAPGLAVDDVVVRVGQPSARLDMAEVAWQVELHLGRPVPGGATVPGALPEAVAVLPVAAISGVDEVWGPRLVDAGLDTVGALAAAGPDVVDRLVALHRSRLPRAFHGRALACRHLAGLPRWQVRAVLDGALDGEVVDALSADVLGG